MCTYVKHSPRKNRTHKTPYSTSTLTKTSAKSIQSTKHAYKQLTSTAKTNAYVNYALKP